MGVQLRPHKSHRGEVLGCGKWGWVLESDLVLPWGRMLLVD